jgi:histidine triad (HIT) family protein
MTRRTARCDSWAECVFCSIAAGKAESSVVYRDDHVMAFMDIQPVTTGHLLVIPREHYVGLADLPSALGGRIFAVGQRLADALRRSALPCEGINMFVADGEVAFQEILHFHLHVFPRTADDSFRISAEWQVRRAQCLTTQLPRFVRRSAHSLPVASKTDVVTGSHQQGCRLHRARRRIARLPSSR